MTPLALLGWMLVAPIVALLAAALTAATYLSLLGWYGEELMSKARQQLESARDALLRDGEIDPLDEALKTLRRALDARDRYRSACYRFGVEP